MLNGKVSGASFSLCENDPWQQPAAEKQTCLHCNGEGKQYFSDCCLVEIPEGKKHCPACGEVAIIEDCEPCEGTGKRAV